MSPRLSARLSALMGEALRWVPIWSARELSGNIAQALELGSDMGCIREAIDHRVKHWGLRLDDVQAGEMAEAMRAAWSSVTV